MAFSRRETALLIIGDFLILAFSLWLALAFRNLSVPGAGYFLQNITPFLLVFLLSIIIFFIAGLYEKQTKLVRSIMGTRILGAQAANVLIAAVLFFVLPLSIAPKTILALYLFISVVLISALRFYVVPQFGVRAPRRALLVGSGSALDEMYEEVRGNNRYALTFLDRISTHDFAPGTLATKVRAAVKAGVELVVIDTHDERLSDDLTSLYDVMLAGVAFVDFSSLYEDIFDRVPLDHITYAWILGSAPVGRTLYDQAKRVFDLILVVPLFLVSLILVLPAVLVLAVSGEPLIFHERIGERGRRFRIVKLRTMLINDHGNPALQQKNRVTTFGRFLRKTRIDELPQLINVLNGDLSFIGPRPELPAIAAVYEREIPYYHTRHLITPGLSGWAQIRDYDAPRGGADVPRTRRKLSYDLYYVKRRSFGLDVGIALKTLRALFAFSGS